ncbi:metallophosphoesterase [Chachezhania antarctica]|uniref:metallophosphoesterase n=1 Tax=Chachezhania antarctica TaxID=2340860 RepID=UPI001F092E43|nr:metallophosphoesterase [Chachezhania antarctica]
MAIGDIHGCDRLLAKLLKKIESVPNTGHLVFVGDYGDRGEESAAVYRRLQALDTTESSVVCLMGNHERMLLDFLGDPDVNGPTWMRHGGLQTCGSFGVSPPVGGGTEQEWYATRDRLRDAMGDIEPWLRGLPQSWESGNVAVVHAAADPSAPIAEQSEDTLLWGHPAFGTMPRQDGTWVVHGHTIVETPMAEMGVISIDTGAYASGRLTAASISADTVSFIST